MTFKPVTLFYDKDLNKTDEDNAEIIVRGDRSGIDCVQQYNSLFENFIDISEHVVLYKDLLARFRGDLKLADQSKRIADFYAESAG